MKKNRLEAFSDGVIAIIITIMVLEMKVPARRRPAGAHAGAAGIPQLPAELSIRGYLLEQPSPHVPGGHVGEWCCVVANLHLLFWLSLLPFTTGWMGENH